MLRRSQRALPIVERARRFGWLMDAALPVRCHTSRSLSRAARTLARCARCLLQRYPARHRWAGSGSVEDGDVSVGNAMAKLSETTESVGLDI